MSSEAISYNNKDLRMQHSTLKSHVTDTRLQSQAQRGWSAKQDPPGCSRRNLAPLEHAASNSSTTRLINRFPFCAKSYPEFPNGFRMLLPESARDLVFQDCYRLHACVRFQGPATAELMQHQAHCRVGLTADGNDGASSGSKASYFIQGQSKP